MPIIEEKLNLNQNQTREVIPLLQKSIELLLKNWTIFIPALVGMIFSQIIKFVAQEWFIRFEWFITHWLRFGIFPPQDVVVGFILMVIRGGVAYFLMFVSLDMARNAYLKKEVDIMKSVDYVRNRLMPFIIASIIAYIFTYSIILIPIAIMMFIIMMPVPVAGWYKVPVIIISLPQPTVIWPVAGT